MSPSRKTAEARAPRTSGRAGTAPVSRAPEARAPGGSEKEPARYFVGVASRDNVQRGVEGGFCQLCHGKAAPLKRMRPGDWIAYYSGKESFDGHEPCQRFTALGRVGEGESYPFDMGDGFVPFRRDVAFLSTAREVDIRPLVPGLAFIPDKVRWGYPFRRGYLEVSREDFALIARAMLGAGEAARLGLDG